MKTKWAVNRGLQPRREAEGCPLLVGHAFEDLTKHLPGALEPDDGDARMSAQEMEYAS